MRVVFVHPSHPSQFTRIVEALDRREGWECACLVDERFTDAVRRDAPPIAYFGFRDESAPATTTYYTRCVEEGLRRGKAVAEALAHLHATRAVDAVVGHASFGTTFFVRALLGVPVVAYVELPGYFPIYCREEFPAQESQSLIDTSLRALIHASVLDSDVCVVPSRHARSLFPEELRRKVRVQVEGFALPPLVADRAALRRELAIPGSGPLIGFAGRTLEAVRGFDVFLRMAKAVHRVRPDVRFLVLGDEATLYGNETAYLGGRSFKQHVMDMVKMDEEAVTFRPFMAHERFTRHLQAMDLAVFPIFEGAGNWGLFEAMAAAVPVLASKRCFIPEAIRHRRDGLLFDPRDLDGLVRTVLRSLDTPDRLRVLGRQARQTIAQRFSVERAADGYASLITEVARSRTNAGRRRRTPIGGPHRRDLFQHSPALRSRF